MKASDEERKWYHERAKVYNVDGDLIGTCYDIHESAAKTFKEEPEANLIMGNYFGSMYRYECPIIISHSINEVSYFISYI